MAATEDSLDYCEDPYASLADRTLWDSAFVPCPQLAFTVPTLVAFQLTVVILFAYVRKYAMKRMGIDPEDIVAILSSRQHNGSGSSPIPDEAGESVTESPNKESKFHADIEDDTTKSEPTAEDWKGVPVFHLPTLIDKYGDRKLRILDSLPRKTVHFLVIGGTMVLLHFTTTTFVSQGQTTILSFTCTTLLLAGAYWGCPESWFAIHLFGSASRIRDGTMGRANLLTSVVVSLVGTLATYMIGFQYIVPHLEDSSFQMLMFVLYYTPLAIGDALGELIGGPFGGTIFPTFRVMGFGEINRKSVEGCFAVFVGSLVGDIVMCMSYGATTRSWMILCLIIAIVTTIVETAAFRSTDNFFIPVSNCLVVFVALGPLGDTFKQL